MSENPNPTPAPSAGDPKPAGEQPKPGEQPAKSFTQADVDRIVQERLDRQAKNQFGDYEVLKAKAGESQTLEQRLAGLETRAQEAEQSALRATIAAAHGISTAKGANGEPSPAELLLTGTDEATLTAQAKALSGLQVEQKKQGNFAPKEGTPPAQTGDDSADLREFTKKLFNKE